MKYKSFFYASLTVALLAFAYPADSLAQAVTGTSGSATSSGSTTSSGSSGSSKSAMPWAGVDRSQGTIKFNPRDLDSQGKSGKSSSAQSSSGSSASSGGASSGGTASK